MSTAQAGCAAKPTDGMVLSENARKVLEARYLKKNEQGECIESAETLFRRVSKTVADVELLYGASELDRRRWEDCFYRIMTSGAFMPNSPTLMNAGREMGMLSACFVLPVRDSIVDIFNTIKHTALIQKAGGGTGFAFDELRPTGDYIRSSGGTTSGPISFWRAFSEATNAIQQGAFRRGANMGMMYIHHPDILKFLHAKQDLEQFNNYNISVKVTDAWMEEFLADPDSPHVVRNPRTGTAYVMRRDLPIWKYTVRDLTPIDCVEPVAATGRERYYRAPRLTGQVPEALRDTVYTKRELWDFIVNNAWQTGEPGVVFMDRINEDNPTPQLGRIEATNPCGEQPLLPFEACNLGSVNLGYFVKDACTPDADVDWEGMRTAIHEATRFLDNVIDANNYPLPEIEQICRDNRKIGLGVMGFADALYKLGVPYDSDDGVVWAERFMKFINDEAHACSELLARERGCFPNWRGSVWHVVHNRMMRNAAVTTVAPTGTISIIANCSGGIEPLFSLAFLRHVLKGQKQGETPLVEVNETFRTVAEDRGLYSDALVERIATEGTVAHIDEIPEDLKRVFVCAHDIAPDWHIRMQAAFQRHCDASISKTINFPNDASRDEIDAIYKMAFRLRCKGITVYRDGCRTNQPMALKEGEKPSAAESPCEKPKDNGESVSEVAHHARAARIPSVVAGCDSTTTGAAPATGAPPRIEPMDLPEIVSGLRIRQMTPFGNMHVKITVDPHTDRELEVFAQLGKGGDVANSDLEAICRLISLWLRSGGSLQLVIKQLQGIGTSLQIPTRTGRIMSLGDGLACALKKYTRVKERFGLRAMLLGEIDPSEFDKPNRPPHHPDTTPMDSPMPPASRGSGPSSGPSNGQGNGQGSGQPAAPVETAVRPRRVETAVPRVITRQVAAPAESQAPKAVHAVAKNGNGKGNGNGHSQSGWGHDVGVAVLDEMEAEPEVVPVVAKRTVVKVLEAESVEIKSAAEKRASASLDIATVLGEVQHKHDSATFYVVKCPDCGSALMRQEGCRKCPGCGWSAC